MNSYSLKTFKVNKSVQIFLILGVFLYNLIGEFTSDCLGTTISSIHINLHYISNCFMIIDFSMTSKQCAILKEIKNSQHSFVEILFTCENKTFKHVKLFKL